MHGGMVAMQWFSFRDLKSSGIVVRHRQKTKFARAKAVITSLVAT
ncbi:hypothetical protein NIES37_12730 [Tolypothrix tenuis PCC 7101]|uniref:Uncharacterized protein n=1 Tax=Tolypothrix tenuis PCC 7101 TaxID=231146 RepID=A0A1Z4MV19_9CYAN|nr:hypothetical protein NIES37_12730 [Tolypothrix tenuis PCC 7101]BAZ72156.1 hypothetical protein NIES50_07090 [Aulosira laxa NIES-50]